MKRLRILVVDDLNCQFICDLLRGKGYDVQGVENLQEALNQIKKNQFDLVVTDLSLFENKGREGIEITRRVKAISPKTEVIVITAHGSIPTAVEAMRLGAFDYVTKEKDFPERLRESVGRALCLLPIASESSEIIGKSALIEKAKELAKKGARSNISVLLRGETGTGKELFAQLIHKESTRREKPFVAINCAAIPEGLAESELFGHVKGAFNDARDKEGIFEAANEGSLFLDEIGTMPLVVQSKLLRVLQDKVIRRVGGTKEIKVDVRIIAATNANLETLIREGRFREDLLSRFGFIIPIPPLRERRADIPLLVNAFIRKYQKTKCDLDPAEQIDTKALDLLMAYSWPRNVRELENQIWRALILSEDEMIREDHLSEEIRNRSSNDAEDFTICGHIKEVLQKNKGNKSRTAKQLGISRPTLNAWIKRCRIDCDSD